MPQALINYLHLHLLCRWRYGHSIIGFPLSSIINSTISSSSFPCQWKCASIRPLHKEGDHEKATNYRPSLFFQLLANSWKNTSNFSCLHTLTPTAFSFLFSLAFACHAKFGPPIISPPPPVEPKQQPKWFPLC